MVYMQCPMTLWVGEWNSQPLDQESNALSKRPLSVGFNCKISKKNSFLSHFPQQKHYPINVAIFADIAQLEGINSCSLGHTYDCPHQIWANYLRIILTSKEVFRRSMSIRMYRN